jgi:hypothetical protein
MGGGAKSRASKNDILLAFDHTHHQRRRTMKTLSKLATAALFAISAAAPALATDPTALQFEERNTFINSTGPVAHQVRTHRATDAMAQAPAVDAYVKNQNPMF